MTGALAWSSGVSAEGSGVSADSGASSVTTLADHDSGVSESSPVADPAELGFQASADADAGTDAGLQLSSPGATASETSNLPNADSELSSGSVDPGCLARTLCEVKRKIRWQSPAWSPAQCRTVAGAVLAAGRRYDLSPTLLLGVMINESDLNEKAARVSRRNDKIYAKDSGLMAVRCVLDTRGRCVNGNLRGLKWKQVMDPATNIALGARELAHWRDGGAYERRTVKVRDSLGRVRPVVRNVPCKHKDHAFWAHYNHGPRYIDRGNPRHYPHHVAVLDHALALVLNLDPPELHRGRITVRDPGRPQRTADHPLEARYRKLCALIESVHACSPVAMN